MVYINRYVPDSFFGLVETINRLLLYNSLFYILMFLWYPLCSVFSVPQNSDLLYLPMHIQEMPSYYINSLTLSFIKLIEILCSSICGSRHLGKMIFKKELCMWYMCMYVHVYISVSMSISICIYFYYICLPRFFFFPSALPLHWREREGSTLLRSEKITALGCLASG